MLAVDRSDAHDWLDAQPWLEAKSVTVVTRRSPQASHGVSADAVLATPRALRELPVATYRGMVNASIPSVMVRP